MLNMKISAAMATPRNIYNIAKVYRVPLSESGHSVSLGMSNQLKLQWSVFATEQLLFGNIFPVLKVLL